MPRRSSSTDITRLAPRIWRMASTSRSKSLSAWGSVSTASHMNFDTPPMSCIARGRVSGKARAWSWVGCSVIAPAYPWDGGEIQIYEFRIQFATAPLEDNSPSSFGVSGTVTKPRVAAMSLNHWLAFDAAFTVPLGLPSLQCCLLYLTDYLASLTKLFPIVGH